jgi:hypothetical protein
MVCARSLVEDTLEHTTLPAPPAAEVVTDLEFIFLGGTKLVHTLRERDQFEDRGDHYYLTWNDTGEDALLYKTSLLQFGRRVRLVQAVDQTAVQKAIQDIKAKEAKAQGATGKAALALVPAPGSPTEAGTGDPVSLWDRSPLKR